MPQFRPLLAAVFLALGPGFLTSPPAAAGGFAQSWAVSGWTWSGEIGSSDADIQFEMLFVHKGDGHYAVFDQLHGTLENEFPALNTSNSTFGSADIDADGRIDLVFHSHPNIVPPFFHVYRWNGSGYVPFLSHSDSVAQYGRSPFRSAGRPELWEVSADPGTPRSDFRLRDLEGKVLFRASTNIPGWAGPYRRSSWVDRNGDGVTELLIEDQAAIRMFHQYGGSFTVAWTLAGWQSVIELGNVDGDSQSEILAVNSADSHYGIVDALTGAVQQEFPALVFLETFLSVEDLDSDGRGDLVARKSVSGQPPVLSIHQWNGVSLAQTASVTATHQLSNLGLLALRGPAQVEILEQSPTDVLLRDMTGALLFQASTDIPGWSVAPFTVGLETADPDHDGLPGMILHDPSHVWSVGYAGTFSLSWMANGWRFYQDLGNMDDDAPSEFMFASSADNRFALFDGVSGTIQQDFPAFTAFVSSYVRLDVDSDGQSELFFGRAPSETPMFTAYHWNGAAFVPTYSHTESIGQWFPVQLRGDSQFEFLEVDGADVRVRDLTATVLFRASTDLPDWESLPNTIAAPAMNFPPQFGPRALFVMDSEQTRFVLHHGPTGVPGDPADGTLRVFPSAPNPFRATTAFRLSNPKAGDVGIRVFDAAGRLVRRLDRRLAAGDHEIRWDGRDDAGRSVPSGVLFYEVTADGIRQTRKLIRMR